MDYSKKLRSAYKKLREQKKESERKVFHKRILYILLLGTCLGILLTLLHEIASDYSFYGSLTFENLVSYRSLLRILFVIACVSIITFFLSSKELLLKIEVSEKERAVNFLSEVGKIAKVGGWELDIATWTQTWSEATYDILEIDLLQRKEKLSGGVNYYSTEDKKVVKEAVKRAIDYGESYDLELQIITAKGRLRWVYTTGKTIVENGVTVKIFGAFQDISRRKIIEEKYRELSAIDSLTTLFNRRQFDSQIDLETNRVNRYGNSLILIMCDIDNFKAFNDTYLHVEGDRALTRFAQVVKESIRKTDLAYRYGGEEFVVILPMTSKDEGLVIAEKIRKKFNEEIFIIGQSSRVHLSVSIGLTEYIENESIVDFVKRADRSMYKAKEDGKNRVVS